MNYLCMKKLTLILLTIITFGWHSQLQARVPMGEWQAFMAYDKTSTCVFFNGKVYAVSEGSLISYDPEDEDIQTFDIVYPMSDINITHLATCPVQRKLLIVYENGNIDLMNEREEVYNITDLKNSNVTDKTINNVNIEGNKAYLATNFGIVVLDIAKREISTTYTLDKKIVDTSVIGDYCILPGTDLTRVGAGIEFYPLPKGSKAIRLHATYCYTFGENGNPAGTSLPEESLFSIGLKWKIDIVSAVKKVLK